MLIIVGDGGDGNAKMDEYIFAKEWLVTVKGWYIRKGW